MGANWGRELLAPKAADEARGVTGAATVDAETIAVAAAAAMTTLERRLNEELREFWQTKME